MEPHQNSGEGAFAWAAGKVRRVVPALYDYGKVHAGAAPYPVLEPFNVDSLAEVVREARERGLKLRVRGSGHTFSGASLPRNDELLVRTTRLDRFTFAAPGTITVGAGALVWDIRDLLRDHGFDLPVYNGGWAGPSLGGYINAGGIGKGDLSASNGGLWENVVAVRLLDGRGQFREVARGDDLFPWIFGGWGQIGLVVEATLRIVPFEEATQAPVYPARLTGRVPRRQSDDPALNDLPPTPAGPRLFWFSLLIAPRQEAAAWDLLAGFVDRHTDVRANGGWAGPMRHGETIGYHYIINYGTFHPPLVWPTPETFLVVGVMSFLESGSAAANARLLEIERDFTRRVLAAGMRLYPQAENFGRQIDLRAYYGEAVWETFRSWRCEIDPDDVINPGFFERFETPVGGVLAAVSTKPVREPKAVVFAGPSIPASEVAAAFPEAEVAPPAQLGDIYRRIGSSVRVIVLIDGYFHAAAPVWHREILSAMASGIVVIGAASMGALRAAELHAYGMIGAGKIFGWYRDGLIEGDDEVKLLHGDETSGFAPSSVPLVNTRATLDAAVAEGRLDRAEAHLLIAGLSRLSFTRRSHAGRSPTAEQLAPERREVVEQIVRERAIDLKREDARVAVALGREMLEKPAPPSSALADAGDDDFAWPALSFRAFPTRDGEKTGREVIAEISAGSPIAGRALVDRRFILLLAHETGAACPEDFRRGHREAWRTRYGITDLDSFRLANRITAAEFEAELSREALVEWLLTELPAAFAPEVRAYVNFATAVAEHLGLAEQIPHAELRREACVIAFLADWARRAGVEAPPVASQTWADVMGLTADAPALARHGIDAAQFQRMVGDKTLAGWLREKTPSWFGYTYQRDLELLRHAQATGLAARILKGAL